MKYCREILSKLSDYIDNELDSENANRIEKHFANCAPCRMVFNTLRKTVEIFRKPADYELPEDVSSGLHSRIRREVEKGSRDAR